MSIFGKEITETGRKYGYEDATQSKPITLDQEFINILKKDIKKELKVYPPVSKRNKHHLRFLIIIFLLLSFIALITYSFYNKKNGSNDKSLYQTIINFFDNNTYSDEFSIFEKESKKNTNNINENELNNNLKLTLDSNNIFDNDKDTINNNISENKIIKKPLLKHKISEKSKYKESIILAEEILKQLDNPSIETIISKNENNILATNKSDIKTSIQHTTETITTNSLDNNSECYVVQVYSSPSYEDANKRLEMLNKKGITGSITQQIIKNRTWYRVRFGNYKTYNDAKNAATESGFIQSWIERIN